MTLKIPVENRVSTYPGRVTMTPVSGQANTYDMVRADMPLTEGTPIDKALLDNKAYTLTEDVTVYVATSGSDTDGDGTMQSPFATIQTAVDALPKHLGGHTATINIAAGTYAERVAVVGFSSGRIVIGQAVNTVTINGIEIKESSFVETNIHTVSSTLSGSIGLFDVSGGSRVLIANHMTIDGQNRNTIGMRVTDNSQVSVDMGKPITFNNCVGTINATKCSTVSVDVMNGTNNVFGVTAYRGSIISYGTDSVGIDWSNDANTGGLVLTGSNSTTLSGATIEL